MMELHKSWLYDLGMIAKWDTSKWVRQTDMEKFVALSSLKKLHICDLTLHYTAVLKVHVSDCINSLSLAIVEF